MEGGDVRQGEMEPLWPLGPGVSTSELSHSEPSQATIIPDPSLPVPLKCHVAMERNGLSACPTPPTLSSSPPQWDVRRVHSSGAGSGEGAASIAVGNEVGREGLNLCPGRKGQGQSVPQGGAAPLLAPGAWAQCMSHPGHWLAG